jgi:hypothetical protein
MTEDVILAIQEAEIKRMRFEASSRQFVRPYLEKKNTQKRVERLKV